MFFCQELSKTPTVQQQQPTFPSAKPSQYPGSAVVATYNIGDYFKDKVPHVIEAIAANLKAADYSNFIAALTLTKLRPLNEIYRQFSLNNFESTSLKAHEIQLYLSLLLMDHNTYNELNKIITTDTVFNTRQPLRPCPLGTLAVGCIITQHDYCFDGAHYVNYAEDDIPEHLLSDSKVANVLLQWKRRVIEKDGSLHKLFVRENSFKLNDSRRHYFFCGLHLHKTELTGENLITLLTMANQQYRLSAAPERYGVALAAVRLIDTVKKNKLAGLNDTQIDEAMRLYPKMLADGMEVNALLPGGKYFAMDINASSSRS